MSDKGNEREAKKYQNLKIYFDKIDLRNFSLFISQHNARNGFMNKINWLKCGSNFRLSSRPKGSDSEFVQRERGRHETSFFMMRIFVADGRRFGHLGSNDEMLYV